MAAEAFTDILERIQGYTGYIYLHVLGEALLHPDLAHLLQISQLYGFQVNLSTNGTLLPLQSQTLLESSAVRQINISLHSCQHLNEQKLEEYLERTVIFAEMARKKGIWISLRFWDVRQDDKTSAFAVADKIGRYLQRSFSLPEDFDKDLAPGQSVILSYGIFLNRESQFHWPHAGEETGDRGTCRGLSDHIAILVDGTVVPCCLDAEADINLGNIHRQSLAQILDGPRARRMRQGFIDQKLLESLCRRCDYRLRFLTR